MDVRSPHAALTNGSAHPKQVQYDAQNDTTLVLTGCDYTYREPPCCAHLWVQLHGDHTDLEWGDQIWFRLGPGSGGVAPYEDGLNWTEKFGTPALQTTQAYDVVSPWPYSIGLAVALGGVAAGVALVAGAHRAIPASLATGTVLGVVASATGVPAAAVYLGGLLWIPLFALRGGIAAARSRSMKAQALWSLVSMVFAGLIVGSVLIGWRFGFIL